MSYRHRPGQYAAFGYRFLQKAVSLWMQHSFPLLGRTDLSGTAASARFRYATALCQCSSPEKRDVKFLLQKNPKKMRDSSCKRQCTPGYPYLTWQGMLMGVCLDGCSFGGVLPEGEKLWITSGGCMDNWSACGAGLNRIDPGDDYHSQIRKSPSV